MKTSFKVLFCGDRKYNNKNRIWNVMLALVKQYGEIVVMHGDAKGADRLAGYVAKEFDLEVQVYPANWGLHGLAAGPIRNRQMLDQKPELVVAFHPFIRKSKGTKDCITEARKRMIEVRVYK